MMKRILTLLLILFPTVVLADGSSPLNFTPTSSDLSVVFLSTIFGTVDGVLYGGSQMMGTMFGIFNAAVLSLGGLMLLYTIFVSTLNTAGEGELLGRQWSSIWIPVRATVGLALLLPKASGYCVMQIFVMWVVLQGIGAADKVWETTLNYMSEGGMIVQQTSAVNNGTSNTSLSNTLQGGAVMMMGVTCMTALQQQLQSLRQTYLDAKAQNLPGPCTPKDADHPITATMAKLCDNPVPDLVATVDPVSMQNGGNQSGGLGQVQIKASQKIEMPYFSSDQNPYYGLKGICGTLKWKLPADPADSSGTYANVADQKTNLRPVAIQQMISDFTGPAQSIVQNDPDLRGSSASTDGNYLGGTAVFPFGVLASSGGDTDCKPYAVAGSNSAVSCDASSVSCEANSPSSSSTTASPSSSSGTDYSSSCTNWVAPGNAKGNPALLTGKELTGAVTDYNSVLQPAITAQSNSSTLSNATNDFINNAKMNGWALAGSYFFNLAMLNQTLMMNSGSADTAHGLEASSWGNTSKKTNFCDNTDNNGDATLCEWYGTGTVDVNNKKMTDLLDATGSVDAVDFSKSIYDTGEGNINLIDSRATSVMGYLHNASRLVGMDTPGQSTPTFTMNFNTTPSAAPANIPSINVHAGMFNIPGTMISLIWNYGIRYLLNLLINMAWPYITQLMFMYFSAPFILLGTIFQTALESLSNTNVNPIIALSNMGFSYINNVMTTFLAIPMYIVPVILAFPIAAGPVLFYCIAMLPISIAWLVAVWSIGVLTAYYIPLLPYIMFTFGVFGWMVAVIEAMVAAPLVALGVTHPEGHQAFGKADQAIMLLLNVFLRPALMIIGFITAISLCYVGVWMMNAGFTRAMEGLTSVQTTFWWNNSNGMAAAGGAVANVGKMGLLGSMSQVTSGPSQWAGLFAYFFLILIYTGMYISIVQAAFELIHRLPDKILQWLSGGHEVPHGGEYAAKGKEIGGKVEKAGGEMGAAVKSISGGKGKEDKGGGTDVQAKATSATGGGISSTPSG